jgi:cell division protease FtsH
MSSGGGAFRSSLRRQKSTVKLSEVAGCDEAKEEVAEIVAYLKDPERFKKSGGTMPKGVLLVGPPGTGKTMLAKAVANEANATFFSVDGSQFVEMFVGVGASRVRAVFEEARKHVPCIIFIDEIDSLAGKREGSDGGNREHNQTVNSLLVAMDGFATNSGVMVIAATNRPEMLDEAVLRPGRFDRKVYLELPDLQGRRAILDIHVAKKASFTLAPDVSLLKVAGETVGFSGADLANLLNEAALHAARAGRSVTQASDIDSARDKVTWGRERSRILSDADRKVIAYHEAGHALLHVVFKQEGYRLQKVTIVPRGRSLGSTHFSPERDIVNLSSPQAIAGIRCLMAGRVAEQVALGQITSGASGDIIESTKRIRSMVLEWAMSDMPFLAYTEHGKPICAPETLALAEKSVADIAEREYRATLEIVQKHRHALDVIAQQLLARETLSGEEVELICQTGHPFVPASAPAPTDGKPQTAGTPTRTSLPTEPPAAAIPPGLPGLACA